MISFVSTVVPIILIVCLMLLVFCTRLLVSRFRRKEPEIPDVEQSRGRGKSVKWEDQETGRTPKVTPQVIPVRLSKSEGPSSPSELENSELTLPSMTMKGTLYRRFARSLGSLFSASDSETMNSPTLADEIEKSSPRAFQDVEENAAVSEECTPRLHASKSMPVFSSNSEFYIDEEVLYWSKNRWKKGIVTKLNPIRVKGLDNFKSKEYEKVRKLVSLPSKIGEAVDEQNVEEMTDEDYLKLMKDIRRNTRASRVF
jgi:hypothetical protein